MKLIVAEKPIAAERIASILGKFKRIKSSGIDVFQLDDMVIVPLKGHALEVDFPKEFNNWHSTPLTKLVDSPINYTPSIRSIDKVLQSYADADQLIIATDYDREGESIGKEAIDMIRQVRKNIPIKRAKFSAITSKEVNESFSNLSDFDFNLADAADSRREIDLIWGAVLTRYISLTSGKMGKDFLSVGRVQTPTLALVVDREKEITAFKPEDFWAVTIDCDKNGEAFQAAYEEEKIFDPQKAAKIGAINADKAKVKSVEKKKVKSLPPTPFSTTDFLRAASNIGYQPKRAMDTAEKLYMSGFTSYPRTDNTYYPESIDLREVLKKFENHKEFGKLAKKLLAKETLTPTHGKKKTTDHPPIYPVEPANKEVMQPNDWKVYELIVRRFFATLAEDSESLTVKADLDYAGENFVARGRTITKQGWHEYYPYSKAEEQFLPELVEGETVKASPVKSEKKSTKPKPRYTQSALIKLMEDNNLGTKSTRAEILQKLIDRGYVTGKVNFTPSQIAFAVIDSLEKYTEDITKPTMTSALEGEMDEVEHGLKNKAQVVSNSRLMLHKVLEVLEKNRTDISMQLRAASFSDFVLGKCDKCGGTLRVIKTKKGTRFVGCSGYMENDCRNSFPLPPKGKITNMNKPCPVCNQPVITVQYVGKRAFEMCVNHLCESKKDWGKKKEQKSAA